MHAGRLLRYPFQKVGQAVGCVEFLRQCDDVPAPACALKSYHRLRSVLTLKDGSRSFLNGDLYHRLSPCFLTGS